MKSSRTRPWFVRLIVVVLLTDGTVGAEQEDPFLVELYNRLHESEAQLYFRELAPMPVGAVYIEGPEDTEADIRWHFRTMRELGFTALKEALLLPETDERRVAEIALEEGLSPWWYGEAGGERITPALLARLGIDPTTPLAKARSDLRLVAHQQSVYRQRAKLVGMESGAGHQHGLNDLERFYYTKAMHMRLPPEYEPAFAEWAKETYKTVEAASRAHNRHHAGLAPEYTEWDDVAKAGERRRNSDFSRLRDQYRFRSDRRTELLTRLIAEKSRVDPLIPFRQGGEVPLFSSMPLRGIDMETVADLMQPGGCFYPSIHLEWHFGLVEHEITRPVYMQASWVTDLFKGGWTFGVETTGGPQQLSGAGQPFTVDDGQMTQLMLSYLAGGFRGFGIWCWNSRTAGHEAGEYALLGRNNEITPRARQVGRIGQAARRWRDELWAARKEPLVGVFYDWDNEAIWAAMSTRGREEFAHYATQARIGLSRALINANVPFEYVTATDLRQGLAARYRVLALPAVVALNEKLWPVLEEYVEAGGRLVVDMPGGHLNTRAELMATGQGSRFEKLFGVVLRNHQGAGVNRPFAIEGRPLTGWIAELLPTNAVTVSRFDGGGPAATEARVGRGTAVILAYEAARSCFRPGQSAAEERLVRQTLGNHQSPYACEEAIVYRLAGEKADHYFLINDAEKTTASLETSVEYTSWSDAVSGESLASQLNVAVPRFSGRWLRAEKQTRLE